MLFRSYSNPRVTKFFYGITGTQRTNSKHLAHTSEKTVLPTKKTALSTPPQSYNKNQSFVSHIVRKFHFHLFDANQFGIPVFIRKSFAGSGYKCASIRHVSFTCRYFCGFVQAGAPTTCKLFVINYGTQRNINKFFAQIPHNMLY